jgi:hypothetical protein
MTATGFVLLHFLSYVSGSRSQSACIHVRSPRKAIVIRRKNENHMIQDKPTNVYWASLGLAREFAFDVLSQVERAGTFGCRERAGLGPFEKLLAFGFHKYMHALRRQGVLGLGLRCLRPPAASPKSVTLRSKEFPSLCWRY